MATVITYLNVGLFVGSLFLFYASIQLRAPDWLEQKGISRLQNAFRKADRVVVHAIAADRTATHNDHLVWNSVDYPISQTLHLDQPQSKLLLDQLKEHELSPYRAGCHDTAYILDFQKDGSSLLRCSLCLHCSNIEVKAYPLLIALVAMRNKETTELTELTTLLNELSKSGN